MNTVMKHQQRTESSRRRHQKTVWLREQRLKLDKDLKDFQLRQEQMDKQNADLQHRPIWPESRPFENFDPLLKINIFPVDSHVKPE